MVILDPVRPPSPRLIRSEANRRVADEILLSKDKTIAIIDGSGTLHDPLGLDRTELTRLAKGRLMISHFDASKLGKDGYKILCDDRDFTLPCQYPLVFSYVCRRLTNRERSWRSYPRRYRFPKQRSFPIQGQFISPARRRALSDALALGRYSRSVWRSAGVCQRHECIKIMEFGWCYQLQVPRRGR